MTVQELIDVLSKCSLQSKVEVGFDEDGFDLTSITVSVYEVADKLNTDVSTVYIMHD